MSPHGTPSRYSNDGCRCDECCSANTAYARHRNAERYAYVAKYGLPPTVEHGDSAYRNWGCRCTVCTAAASAARSEDYRARRARTKPT